MSKTDKTAPYWVKQTYDPSYLEEVHDHRFHECDLPPRPEKPRDLQWYGHDDRPCFWWVSWTFWRSRWGKCHCYMCGPYAYEPDPSRKRRREEREYLRDGWRDEY